jgi:hypothetical protein
LKHFADLNPLFNSDPQSPCECTDACEDGLTIYGS